MLRRRKEVFELSRDLNLFSHMCAFSVVSWKPQNLSECDTLDLTWWVELAWINFRLNDSDRKNVKHKQRAGRGDVCVEAKIFPSLLFFALEPEQCLKLVTDIWRSCDIMKRYFAILHVLIALRRPPVNNQSFVDRKKSHRKCMTLTSNWNEMKKL